jgi:hypothetical protein
MVDCLIFPLCFGKQNDPDTEIMWTVKWFLASLVVSLDSRGNYPLNIYAEAAFAMLQWHDSVSKTGDPEPKRNHGVLITWLEAEMAALILLRKLLCHKEKRAQNIVIT